MFCCRTRAGSPSASGGAGTSGSRCATRGGRVWPFREEDRGRIEGAFRQKKGALRIEHAENSLRLRKHESGAPCSRRKREGKRRDAFSSGRSRVAGQDEKARAFRGRTWRCALSDATRACFEVIASPPRVAVTRACAGEARPSRTSAPRRLVASRSSHSLFVSRPSTRGWSSSRARHVVSAPDGGMTRVRASVADDMRSASPRAWCQCAGVSCERNN